MTQRRRTCFPLSWPSWLKCRRDRDGQSRIKLPPWWCDGTDMAPSTQLKEAISDMQAGIRGILLGPPGAGKGTQVGEEC